MADERVVATKLEQIEQYHGELNAKQQSLAREEFLTETTEQRAVERMFENAIQACSDLAKHVASQDFDFDGDTAKEAIRVLGREGVIDEEPMDTLVAAVGFRNVLAHEYGTVDYGEVYETLQLLRCRVWSPLPQARAKRAVGRGGTPVFVHARDVKLKGAL